MVASLLHTTGVRGGLCVYVVGARCSRAVKVDGLSNFLIRKCQQRYHHHLVAAVFYSSRHESERNATHVHVYKYVNNCR